MSRVITATLAACVALAAVAAHAEPKALNLDEEAVVDGVPVACTGIGQTKHDPKWQAYPVRVELSDAQKEYLTDGAITVTDAKGAAVVSFACQGPWLLLKLTPGSYRIEGRLLHQQVKPRSASFKAPASGQMRVVLQFPDASSTR